MQGNVSQPIYVGFASQKGGVGKSSLAKSWLRYYTTSADFRLWLWIVIILKSPFISYESGNVTLLSLMKKYRQR